MVFNVLLICMFSFVFIIQTYILVLEFISNAASMWILDFNDGETWFWISYLPRLVCESWISAFDQLIVLSGFQSIIDSISWVDSNPWIIRVVMSEHIIDPHFLSGLRKYIGSHFTYGFQLLKDSYFSYCLHIPINNIQSLVLIMTLVHSLINNIAANSSNMSRFAFL